MFRIALILLTLVLASCAQEPPQDSASHFPTMVRISCAGQAGPNPLIYVALSPGENAADHCPPGSTFTGISEMPRAENIPSPCVSCVHTGGGGH